MTAPRTYHNDNITRVDSAHTTPTKPTHPLSFYRVDSDAVPLSDDALTLAAAHSHSPARNSVHHRANPLANTPARWPRIRSRWREFFSEFWATFILVLFGDGAVAQVVLSGNGKGDWLSICLGWGIGVMLGAYTGGASGAHMNPAVTLAMCVYRRLPWKKLPSYVLAQLLGAMFASLIVYGNYVSAINRMEGGQQFRTAPGYSPYATAGIFATYPADFMNSAGQFFSEFVASGILVFCVFALLDDTNLGAKNLTPLGLFMVITGIGIAFGWETGFAINPARDFGPRIVSSIVGYGRQPWTTGNHYFWVPIFAPLLGGTFGGFVYDLFLFSGEGPINEPALGLRRERHGNYKESPV